MSKEQITQELAYIIQRNGEAFARLLLAKAFVLETVMNERNTRGGDSV